jgi:hypothetical protein
VSLTISEEVKQRLAPFLTETNTFLLVANDGSNPYSSAEGCCMIGDRFIIVPVDQALLSNMPLSFFKVMVPAFG